MKQRTNMVRRFLAVGVAAAASVVFCSSPALAGQFAMAHTTDGKDWGGKAFFDPDGDVFKVCDLKSDGMKAEMSGDYPGGTASLIASKKGKCTTQAMNIRENATVKIKVCLLANDVDRRKCSGWSLGSA
ncbi:hypothetical protein [Streptomyces sp. bgisy100]|uniref:hypothetical protein n=1 Tax=Streptomyces sp. bgisy100 TaxID=3413783 RepID=UPI003D716D5B